MSGFDIISPVIQSQQQQAQLTAAIADNKLKVAAPGVTKNEIKDEVASAEDTPKIDLPEVPKTEPADDGPSPKKHKTYADAASPEK